jgi:hypothetical protein
MAEAGPPSWISTGSPDASDAGGSVHYYCYISEGKIDQLLTQFSAAADAEATAQEFQSSPGQLARMIRGTYRRGGQYGKPVASSTWLAERRQDLVRKLLAALGGLERTAGGAPALLEMIQLGQAIRPGIYLYEGEFTARRYDRDFVYIESSLPDGSLLKLTCSLKYFSDVCDPSGNLILHSGNVMFLSGEVSPLFHALVYVLQSKDKAILGTPLFLGLPLNSPLQL